MIEKIRIFLSQLIATTLFIVLIVWAAVNAIVNLDINNRLASIRFNYESFEAIAVGLLLAYLSALSMIFIIWLMRGPKTNYAKKKKKKRKTARVKKIDMGTVKNIPTDR